jgi:hypothetical protein
VLLSLCGLLLAIGFSLEFSSLCFLYFHFVHHLVVMKEKYGSSKQLSMDKSKPILKLNSILSLAALNMQANLFKLTMQSNGAATMLQKPFQMNPMTRMWLIDDNSHLWYQLSKF